MNAPANLPRSKAVRQLTQPRRGLSREEAAVYVGVSPTTFSELVEAGRMPPPKLIGARRVWDLVALDSAFEALPDGAEGQPMSSTGAGGWD